MLRALCVVLVAVSVAEPGTATAATAPRTGS